MNDLLEHRALSYLLAHAEIARDTAQVRSEYSYQRGLFESLESEIDELELKR